MIAGILTAAMGTYLCLTMQEHQTVKRSLSWNAALPMAEAGIEEALSHLNINTNNWSADGWTTNSAGEHLKQHSLGDGSYSVNFSGRSGAMVVITSTGSVATANSLISRTVRVSALTRNDFKNYPLSMIIITPGPTKHREGSRQPHLVPARSKNSVLNYQNTRR